MSLTWTQIRLRANSFAKNWSSAKHERSEAQSFYNEFFEIFGISRRTVVRFERHVERIRGRRGFIDAFWPGVLIIEHKSGGADLAQAESQADEYFDALPEHERPRYRLVSDFASFRLADLDTGDRWEFPLAKLPEHVECFGFLIGKHSTSARARPPLTDKACELVAKLFEEIKATGYDSVESESLVARLVYCFFADSSGVFQPRGIFLDLVESRQESKGRDLGPRLALLFDVLNTEPQRRSRNLDPDFSLFPYINGRLFSERLSILSATDRIWQSVVDAASFDWSLVSPAIFGSLFDGVMTAEERASSGSYATSEKVILAIADDLFLGELRRRVDTFKQEKDSTGLRAIRRELRSLKIFDPACGCGNFLAVIYREMRRLELEVVKALIEQKSFNRDVDTPLLVDVDQFYGIESRATSREIAILALWMVDHLENRDAELFLGVSCSRIPLRVRPLIIDGNALACDWNSVLPSEECSFLVGNPPYLGSKKMTEEQRSLVAAIRGAGMGPGTLDLASAWFFKAADYVSAEAKAALVVTSSIVQGEQVGQFFPNFSRRAGGIQMDFCYPPFEWMPPNRSGPTVHVVVIGFSRRVSEAATGCKKIRAYGGVGADYTLCVSAISPYMRSGDGLVDPDVVVHERSRPADNRARIVTGSKPIDGGYYIFTADEARELVEEDNRAARYLRPFIGGEEFLTGTARFIAYFGDDAHLGYRSIPAVKDVIRKVRDYRRGEIASKDGLRAISNAPHVLADEPTRWHLTVVPSSPYLIIPEVTSENRRYIPIGWAEPPSIPSNLVKVMLEATLFDFGLLTSAMHMAWIRAIGGRLTGRYRYSIHLLYNNFPLPAAGNLERMAVEEAAKRVLASRKGYLGVSLEAMYDPQVMPRDLANAHSDLDRAVDRCYQKERFGDDDARFVFLLNLYRERTQAEAPARGAGGRRVRRGG